MGFHYETFQVQTWKVRIAIIPGEPSHRTPHTASTVCFSSKRRMISPRGLM